MLVPTLEHSPCVFRAACLLLWMLHVQSTYKKVKFTVSFSQTLVIGVEDKMYILPVIALFSTSCSIPALTKDYQWETCPYWCDGWSNLHVVDSCIFSVDCKKIWLLLHFVSALRRQDIPCDWQDGQIWTEYRCYPWGNSETPMGYLTKQLFPQSIFMQVYIKCNCPFLEIEREATMGKE